MTPKVHFRGSLPCQVLVVGESPGISGRTTKVPFAPMDPAGSVLQNILNQSIGKKSYGITTAVACTPYNEQQNGIVAPSGTAITACSLRVEELINIAEPEYIIAAGKVAAKQLSKLGYEFLEIQHPTKIASQGDKGYVDLKRCILQIREYIN